MSQLITLSKDSADFKRYLNGTFSKDLRALPIESLNVNTNTETVTFKIVPKGEIHRPHFFDLIIRVLRPTRFVFILFPLLFLLLEKSPVKMVKDPLVVIWSTIGLIFLYGSVQLRNDYHDYMNGLDRLSYTSSSQVILNGWVTAEFVKQLSWIFSGVSFLCSIPVLLVFPKILAVMALAGLLLFWSLFRGHSSFKNVIAGEIVFGILLGPILAAGYEISITGNASLNSIFFGVVWGALILFRFHLSHFENILVYSQAKLRNMVTYWGFDKAKRNIFFWWIGVVTLFFVFEFFTVHPMIWSGTLILLLIMSRKFYFCLRGLASPIGSGMKEVQSQGQQLFNLFVLLWLTQIIFGYLALDLFNSFLRGI